MSLYFEVTILVLSFSKILHQKPRIVLSTSLQTIRTKFSKFSKVHWIEKVHLRIPKWFQLKFEASFERLKQKYQQVFFL